MRKFRPHIVCLIAAGLSSAVPRARAITQTESLAAAAAAAKAGSDNSLRNSTSNAMRAMLDLNAQNQPSAMNHGYQAFGEYRTSQNLDMDRMRNRIRQIDLFTSTLTVNSVIPAGAANLEDYRTTYARLDPNFLRQGETGKVADEFEKKSGMSRDLFLKRMAESSESMITADDPNLTAKVMKRFSRFVNEIPNDEFRNRVQEQIDASTGKSRSAMIMNGAKHVFEVLAAKGIDLGHKVADYAQATSPEIARAPASEVDSSKAFTDENPPPARPEDPLQADKSNFFQKMAPNDAPFRGLDHERFSGDAVGGIMQTALDEQGESTIFRQVSKRYRVLAPLFKLTKE
jgi:hypothetical protein